MSLCAMWDKFLNPLSYTQPIILTLIIISNEKYTLLLKLYILYL